MFSHEVAFPFHQAIVLCHLGEKKKAGCMFQLSMTKSNMFIRKRLTYYYILFKHTVATCSFNICG